MLVHHGVPTVEDFVYSELQRDFIQRFSSSFVDHLFRAQVFCALMCVAYCSLVSYDDRAVRTNADKGVLARSVRGCNNAP
jgi:hypothetical protein